MKREALSTITPIYVLPLLAVMFLLAVPAVAQDIGEPDTVRYEPTTTTWNVDIDGNTFDINLMVWTDDPAINACQFGFMMATSTGGGYGHDDSLIVIDTFMHDLTADIAIYQWSVLDSASYPEATSFGFNGYIAALINIMSGAIFVPDVHNQMGTLTIKMSDPTLLPESFDITLDSTWFPPAAEFLIAPQNGQYFHPQYVMPTIHVNNVYGGDNPVIELDPTAFDFMVTQDEGNPPDQTLFIANGANGTLNWSVSDDAPWLSLAPSSGSGDGSVTLSVDATGYTPGTYYATITVTDPGAANSPRYADVTFTVLNPITAIELYPTFLSFGAFTGGPNPASQSFTITNVGAGVLDWTASPDVGWITVDPPAGAGDATVTVTVDKGGMSEGIYTGTISVSDPYALNSPQTVTVSMELFSTPPYIMTDKNFIFFNKIVGEPDPPAQTLTITNDAGGEIDWTATKTNDWLVLNESSGTTPSTIIVSADFDFLPGGFALDTILVASSTAINSPEMVLVMASKHAASGEYAWGDADCSSAVDIDDVVYLINYIFASGPPPGDPDNDGTPNCP